MRPKPDARPLSVGAIQWIDALYPVQANQNWPIAKETPNINQYP